MPSQLEGLLQLFLHRRGGIYIENSSGFPFFSMVRIGSTYRHGIRFSTRSDRPVGCLACPARFERATYALEAL
ncbi:MAG: hypothetical protein RIR83_1460, partial [Pseudomonadota bacterium]